MKTSTILITTILALFAGQSRAGEFSSLAYVNQVDKSAFSRISTKDIVRPAIQVAQTLAALRPDNGNLGLIWQNDTNTASTTQNGTGNVGLIRQIGLHNVASIDQSGSSHQALVLQQGRGNYAFIQQR